MSKTNANTKTCPKMAEHSGSAHLRRDGKTPSGTKLYTCDGCRRTFTAEELKAVQS